MTNRDAWLSKNNFHVRDFADIDLLLITHVPGDHFDRRLTDPASAEWIPSALQARVQPAVHLPKGGYKERTTAKKEFPNLIIATHKMDAIQIAATD